MSTMFCQTAEYTQSWISDFKGAFYEGSNLPFWLGPDNPMELDDGQIIYPANLATALFYSRYPTIESAQHFTSIWTEFGFGDLHRDDNSNLSPMDMSAQAIADVFSFPLGSPAGNGYRVTQEFGTVPCDCGYLTG